MTILTLLALLLVVMLVASALPVRQAPPVILVQAIEPAGSPGTGCLPLILLVVAVAVALTLL